MNREEFLRQLEQLLRDIPESERREAMEYYQNYFEDAGPEREAEIIEELGSPYEVAESIKKDLFGENYMREDVIKKKAGQNYDDGQRRQNNTTRNILIAVIVVLTFPFWVGIVAGAFGILVGAIVCIFALVVALIAIVGAFFIAGFVMAGIGIVKMLTGFPAVGMILLAIGMFMLAASLLGLLAVVWIGMSIVPWVVRSIVNLCRKIFQKRGAAI
ncbi:MAG: DUF1700 domain-containing protein [Lachnospiraceae bacterium]|nr:DUF1700 domain-containing protein [Lachnospiraceae bacterium]